MTIKDLGLDLSVARRRSGLFQKDSALLLGVDQTKISLFERGKLIPNLREMCALSLIYGQSFERFFEGMLTDIKTTLRQRLGRLPSHPKDHPNTFNRQHTLDRLAKDLEEDNDWTYGGRT